ncbi:MAG: NAD(P)H-dependent oxidoreductase [Cellvibrionaceae bacterium]
MNTNIDTNTSTHHTASNSRVIRIDSSARGTSSNSNQITAYLAQQLQEQGAELLKAYDLGVSPLPHLSSEELVAVHGSVDTGNEYLLERKALSDQLIAELKQADTLVLGAPMYNFGVPAVLKQWVDYIARAGETFRYTENGPQGLTGIENAYVVVATGGTPVGSDWDHVSGYLKTVLSFIGVKHVHIVDASGSKGNTEEILAAGREQVDAFLAKEKVA